MRQFVIENGRIIAKATEVELKRRDFEKRTQGNAINSLTKAELIEYIRILEKEVT